MAVDPSNDLTTLSAGEPAAAFFASVFFTTRYLLFVSRIFVRRSVSWAIVIPWNWATNRFFTSASSFFNASSSSFFLPLDFMFAFYFLCPSLLRVQCDQIQIDARAHGSRNRYSLHVLALQGRR